MTLVDFDMLSLGSDRDYIL